MEKSRHLPGECHYAKVERLEERASSIGQQLGVIVTTQRDPRGASVKIDLGGQGRWEVAGMYVSDIESPTCLDACVRRGRGSSAKESCVC